MSDWTTKTRRWHSKRPGANEVHCSTSLLFRGEVVHTLPGPYGKRNLENRAALCNEKGHVLSRTSPLKCRGEATERERQKWDDASQSDLL